MKRMMGVLLFIGLLALQAPSIIASEAFVIYTLPIKHRAPESLAETLSPLVTAGGYITATDNKLILKTTPENFEEIFLLLRELDTPVQQLLISVRKSSEGDSRAAGLTTHGNITTGRVRVDGKPIDDSARIRVKKTTGWGKSESSYQLRTTEGEKVFIQTGQEIPIQSRYGLYGGAGEEYKPVVSGISVIARLRGEHVVLDLIQQSNKVDGRNIDTQSLSSQLNARLGEWILVGGIQSQTSSKDTGIVRYQTQSQGADTSIYIKIDKF